MRWKSIAMVLVAGCAAACAQTSGPACEQLSQLKFEGVEITRAASMPASEAHLPWHDYDGPIPAYCRVEGVMNRRTGAGGAEYGIGFALALPEKAAWNGDFLMQGGGGSNGVINEPYGASFTAGHPALTRGFAVVSTDTGHKAPHGGFDFGFMHDQQAYLDFAYQANAAVAELAKKIIAAYYPRGAAHSYFVGCSTGGREGMILTQRFPSVFDGVVSGDPAMRTGRSNLAIGQWIPVAYNQASPKDASGKPQLDKFLNDAERKLFIDALLDRCDARDGVKDGMIFDPLGCDFDPATIACKPGGSEGCIAPEKIAAIKKAFSGPKNSYGTQVYPGFLYDSGIAVTTGLPGLLAPHAMGLFGPTTTATTIDVDKLALRDDDPLVEPSSRQLNTFYGRGGKLLFFHGDSDPWFSPLDTFGYYQSMAEANGGVAKTMEWSRFFFVPGMGHCGGGPSLDRFDMLTAVVDWVEKGQAPEFVVARGQSFPKRSRPLCAYPKHAQYKGTGDAEDAVNYECR